MQSSIAVTKILTDLKKCLSLRRTIICDKTIFLQNDFFLKHSTITPACNLPAFLIIALLGAAGVSPAQNGCFAHFKTLDLCKVITGRSNINEHILNIYKEKELSMRKIGISDFSTEPTNFYNLDVVISVGYRVKSH